MKIIKVISKKFGTFEVIVDKEDFKNLSQFNWHIRKAKKRIIVCTKIDGEVKYMGRMVINAEKDETVNYINGNTLDNRKQNLSKTQHLPKDSKYKGVYRRYNKWIAIVKYNNKQYIIGYYDKEEEAAKAYDIAKTRLHYGKLNFPKS